MGQMTYGVLYGVHQAPPEFFEEGWQSVIAMYKPRGQGREPLRLSTPSGDGPDDFLGFWVAVGASGEPDVPFLEAPFALDNIANSPYRDAALRAERAWHAFVPWFAKHVVTGNKLPAPRLYLVMTEVA